MANYPSPPDNRIAYDLDGSVLVKQNDNGFVTMTQADMQLLNDESIVGLTTDFQRGGSGVSFDLYAILFPSPVNLTAYYMMYRYIIGGDPFSFTNLETSPDTTNGVDGTWTTAYATPASDDGNSFISLGPAYRTNFQPLVVANVKGVRFTITKTSGAAGQSTEINGFHLYGESAAPPQLQIWDPLADHEINAADFDWGDIPQSSNDIRTFRVHNYSALTAQDITLSFDSLTPGTPASTSWHYFSFDNINYHPTLNIGSLAPGFTSGIIYVQRVTPDNAELNVGALRIVATATFV